MSTQLPSIVELEKNGFAVTNDLAAAFDEESSGTPREEPLGLPVVRIDHDRGKFVMPDGTFADAIEGYTIYQFQRRSYWKGTFKVGDHTPPTCWSNDMIAPSEAAEKQSALCKDCKHNEWGSGVGDGKACRQQLFIFLLNPALGNPPAACLLVPPSSLKAFVTTNSLASGGGGYFLRAERFAGRFEICWMRARLDKVEGAKHCVVIPEIVDKTPSIDEAKAIGRLKKSQIQAMESFRSSVALLEDQRGGDGEMGGASEQSE